MNWDQVKGNWKQFTGQVRERWGEFTDDELEEAKGRREQFEGLLQKKFGWAKEQVKREMDEFEKSCAC
jgi:uncharacterized protein YjbJ (UPF0337 family)